MKNILLLFIAYIIHSSYANGQDIALHKSCTVSPLPNYSYIAGKNNASFLTDGIYAQTSKAIWVDPKTLGWSGASIVTITIDLGKIQSVSSIILNTALESPEANVQLPISAMVFLSNDSSSYRLAGDLAFAKTDSTAYANKLILDNIHQQARYITIKVKPGGSFFFTDEVSVMADNKNKLTSTLSSKIFKASEEDSFTLKSTKGNIYKIFLDKYLNHVTHQNINKTKQNALSVLKNKIQSDYSIDSTAYEDYVLKIESIINTYSSNNSLSITPIDPWTDAELFDIDTTTVCNLKSIPLGGVQYFAYSIKNNSSSAKVFNISDINSPVVKLSYYDALYVRSADFKTLPDALLPIDAAHNVSIQPGEAKFLFIKVNGIKEGSFNKNILLSCGAEKKNIPVNVTVSKEEHEADSSINTIVWAYYSYPFLHDKIPAAYEDLLGHHINTMVIPPNELSFSNPLNIEHTLGPNLLYYKGFKSILLYLNFTNEATDTPQLFETDAWKERFLNWYDQFYKTVKTSGFDEDNFYLYLVDEIKPAQVQVFIKLATWIKSVRPKAKFYATANDNDVITPLLPHVDVIQIIHRNKSMITNLDFPNKWIYDYRQPTKSAPPYSYYRLLPWNAFAEGCSGVGFWNYADVGSDKKNMSVWDDFDGKRADYAVVYNDVNGKLLSSRRWEAFKLGLEDFYLLKAYAKKYGQQATLQLCQSVLHNVANHNLADSVREKMMQAL